MTSFYFFPSFFISFMHPFFLFSPQRINSQYGQVSWWYKSGVPVCMYTLQVFSCIKVSDDDAYSKFLIHQSLSIWYMLLGKDSISVSPYLYILLCQVIHRYFYHLNIYQMHQVYPNFTRVVKYQSPAC